MKYSLAHKYTNSQRTHFGMCEHGCPVPDKSACCQSIRPVRASLSTIQPEASVSRCDRATTLRTLDSTDTRFEAPLQVRGDRARLTGEEPS
jgi:hypothetical protein